jgi:thioredoxin 1
MLGCPCHADGGDSLWLYALVTVFLMWAAVRIQRKWRCRIMAQEKRAQSVAIKALIVIALVVVVGVALYAKRAARKNGPVKEEGSVLAAAAERGRAASPEPAKAVESASAQPGAALPKLVDLGAGKCIPCKMMAPILEELKGECKGRFDVVFVDVWENPKAGEPYGIKLIPTQIFFDAKGKELFRHEGFFSKEDILAKWKELGIEFGDGAGVAPPPGNS